MRLPERLTLALGVSMTIGYGTLYYPFSILGPEIAQERGWAESFVFGVFSIALLASAAAASLAGHMLDRFGGRRVLMAGSALAFLTLSGLSQVETRLQFALAMLLVEIGSCLALYEAGFAALTAIHGLGARRHITHVTLVAGFASTVFWPLVHWLLGVTDWRGVLMVLAAINLLVALPIHAMLPKMPALRPAVPGDEVSAPAAREPGLLAPATRRPAYLIMAVSFACSGFLMSAVHTSFFLILENIGRSAGFAALAGALIGPMQVGARLVELISGGRVASSVVGVVSSAALLAGLALLVLALWVSGPLPVIFFAAFFGIGQGLTFIARAVLPARLFGTAGYGRITGNLSAIRLVFTAAGPFLTALTISSAGLGAALAMLALMAVVGLVASAMLAVLELRAQTRPWLEN